MSDGKWMCSVEELVQATGGKTLSSPHPDFSLVGTDTRQDLSGKLFVPLKGESFDAHNFIDKAIGQNARVILVHEWREEWKPFLTRASFVQVPDTLHALQALARHWRKKHKFKVIAITGSNGKTSTKEFAYAVLKDFLPTSASRGSLNNHWGVPISILSAYPHHKMLIQEMGMNHSGEIWRLCQIAEPDIVGVTTVGRSHIGELGSQAAIAQAKEEIYTASVNSIKVFNMDNEWTMRMHSRSHGEHITYSSFRENVDVNLRAQRLNWDGLDIIGHIGGVKGHVWVHVLGRQNTVNLMAAAAFALAAGMSPEMIWQKLGTIHDTAWGRNQMLQLQNGARVLFDAYNCNPDSMTAMLKCLYEMDVPGRKFVVAGDMLELGTFSEAAHEEVGERAGGVMLEGLWYLGKNAAAFEKGVDKATKPKWYRSTPDYDAQIAKELLSQLQDGDVVAIKASRGMALERVLDGWPLQTPLGKKP